MKKNNLLCMQRLLFVIFLSVILCLLLPPKTYAHVAGQPPFFKINGVYSDLYPIQASSYTNAFVIPQDLAAETYLVNKPLLFKLDTKFLPFPEELVSHTDFLWDFGDGNKGTGLINTHIYKKIGSYILTITISSKNSQEEKQLLQSVMLHVLPNKNYVLPKISIKVNGKTSKDFPTGVIEQNLKKEIIFDASTSSSNMPIASYVWDFDNGTKASGAVQKHIYIKPRELVAPILRVTDKNGFIVDSSETILNKTITTSLLKKSLRINMLLFFLFPLIVIVIIVLLILKKNK